MTLLQSARCNSLLQEAELQSFLKLIATHWKQGGISGVCLRVFVIAGEQVSAPKESSFPIPSTYIDVTRQAKTDLEKLEGEQDRWFLKD